MFKRKLFNLWVLLLTLLIVSNGSLVFADDAPVAPPAPTVEPTAPAVPTPDPAVPPAPAPKNPPDQTTPPTDVVPVPNDSTKPADPPADATKPADPPAPPKWKPANPKPVRKPVPDSTKVPNITIINSPGSPAAKRDPTPQELQLLYQMVWNSIARSYVNPKSLAGWDSWLHKYDGKLNTVKELDDALAAMVGSIGDRWTRYTSLTDQKEAAHKKKDGFVHAGLDIQKLQDGKWHIDAIVRGSSAYNTFLRERDVVVSINGKPLANITAVGDVGAMLIGKTGSKLPIVVEVNGKEVTTELILKEIPEDKGDAELLPGNVAYIRLPNFVAEGSANSIAVALASLYQKAGGDLQGILLDLRNNPGGRVEEAIASCSLFIEKGVIFRQKTRDEREMIETTYSVEQSEQFRKVLEPAALRKISDLLEHKQMVVLINGSSASASEVLTGALKDNHRALIIGTTTFGKGVGYSQVPLPTGGMFSITGLTYVTPNGYDLSGKGLEPDRVVENPRDTNEDIQLKAALDHFHALIKERLAQIKKARDLATQPQGIKPSPSGATIWNSPIDWEWTSTKVLVPTVSTLLTLGIFLAIVKRFRKTKEFNQFRD